jgi:hypothetical protein
VASTLKHWIERTTSGQCDVFVSTDVSDNPAGSNWMAIIERMINESFLMIVVCSKFSLSRPWINFEAGAAWQKKIPILPVLHSGLTVDQVPRPISDFQGVSVDEPGLFKRLFEAIYGYANLTKFPDVDSGRFEKEMVTAAEQATALAAKDSIEPIAFEPEDLQRRILQCLIAAYNARRVGMDEVELATVLKITISSLIKSINTLVAQKLVYKGLVAFQGVYIPDTYYYRVTPDGIDAVLDHRTSGDKDSR